MKRATNVTAAAAIFSLVVAASCNRGAPPQVAASPTPAPLPPAPSASAVAATIAWVVPPLGLKTPMEGEPPPAAFDAARLVAKSCTQNEQAVNARIDQQIAAMRASVEQSYARWKDEPRCDELFGHGEAFGYGGLGLSGVGEGGGGAGEGIGLGSIGTIGHGAGRAVSASGTNNQVAGVDEADIVKNDGAYVYIVSNGALRIVEALHPRLLSVTKLAGDVKELLLEGDRAVAFVSTGGKSRPPCTYGYDCTFGGDGTQTKLVVLDVSDRNRPRITRRIELSGSLLAARRIGSAVHVVVADGESPEPSYETWPTTIPSDCQVKGMDGAAVRARFTQLERDNERTIRAAAGGFPTLTENGVSKRLCAAMHAPDDDGEAFTSVVSFDLHDDKAAPTTAVVESRPGVVFASQRGLYFSVRQSPSPHGRYGAEADEASTIHEFRIGAAPGDTRYVGSGIIPGHVLNQFAMDEWYGYLRVATTRGRVPDPDAESVVSVLSESDGGTLVRIGAVDHIAPGEDIRAVRFDGERAYVVTFKKTDPLFVLDLGHPAAPAILGELKIPGFSTYLHRVDPTHLLAIGFDANDHGSFAYFDGIILQLFDVTKPTEPALLFKEKLGTRGSSSAAATDHLAFNYFDEKKLLAIPMTICDGGGDGTYGSKLAFSGLLVYDVSIESGFKRLGGVDHGKAGTSCNTWWANATSKVKRSIFMDDLVFSIASDRMKVQRMGKLGVDVGDIALGP
jgi:Beta propeller domain